MRVVGHVEHGGVLHWPDAALFTTGTVHQHGMPLVDAAGDLSILAACGTRARCRCWGSRGRSPPASAGKQRSGSLMVSVSWRKKAHAVSSNLRSSPPNISAQNLNRESTSGKKGGRPVPRRRFSKSNRPPKRPLVETDLKKSGRRQVGVDAGGREQTHEAIGLDQSHRPLDEQRVQVDIAAAQQRVVAGRANQPAQLSAASFAASNSAASGSPPWRAAAVCRCS